MSYHGDEVMQLSALMLMGSRRARAKGFVHAFLVLSCLYCVWATDLQAGAGTTIDLFCLPAITLCQTS
jgi:hypothetical protein